MSNQDTMTNTRHSDPDNKKAPREPRSAIHYRLGQVSGPNKIVTKEGFTGPVMGPVIHPAHLGRFIRVNLRHGNPQTVSICSAFGLGQQVIEPTTQIRVVPRCTTKIPDQLGGTYNRNCYTSQLSDNWPSCAKGGNGTRPQQNSHKQQQTVNPLQAGLAHIVIQRRPQQLKPHPDYFGGRTPGGWPTGFGVAGGGDGRGGGDGGFAHLESLISNMSPLKFLFIGDVAGRVFGLVRPAANANGRSTRLHDVSKIAISPAPQEDTMTDTRHTATPTPLQIKGAQEILSNPEQACDTPALFLWSWRALKQARGQSINLDRIGAAAHRVQPVNNQFDRIRAKIRAHAAQRGYPLADTLAPRAPTTQRIGA